jgi:hypothetical protein
MGRYSAVPGGKGKFMTRYFINDREIAAPADFTSFDKLLKYMEESHLEPDTVIRQIFIDGHPYTLDALDDGTIKSIENLEKIEIVTSPLVVVARDSIEGALEYLSRVEMLAPSLSIKFQDYPDADAFQNLKQLYEGFYFINLLLERLSVSYGIKLGEAIIGDISVQEHLEKFISVLKQLNECKENRDYALIADILEYEIIPIVPIWKEIFGFVSKKIEMTQ